MAGCLGVRGGYDVIGGCLELAVTILAWCEFDYAGYSDSNGVDGFIDGWGIEVSLLYGLVEVARWRLIRGLKLAGVVGTMVDEWW